MVNSLYFNSLINVGMSIKLRKELDSDPIVGNGTHYNVEVVALINSFNGCVRTVI